MSLLEIEDLVVEFPGRGWRARPHRALDGVDLDVRRGETVGLVGESGSGKTTMGRAVLGLQAVTSGVVRFEGREIQHLHRRERRRLATRVQVVFQDPYSSLNPALTIGDILSEPLRANGVPPTEARARVSGLLDQVRLPTGASSRLPREFSGGQRQRIAIARALALEPRLVVCDEPVSALDLSTQARVLDLLVEIQEQTGVAYLFVSHDLAVVRHVSHRVSVLYRGRVVESGECDQVTARPEHAYTRALLGAAPVADPARQRERREQREAVLATHTDDDTDADATRRDRPATTKELG